jgi:anaerobic C4-dicarboxylate transporter
VCSSDLNLFIDCFAIVMVFMAMRNVKGLFLIATAYASLADFAIPLFNMYVSGTTLSGVYLLEAPYLLLGLIGLSGLLRSRNDPIFAAEPLHRGKPHAR